MPPIQFAAHAYQARSAPLSAQRCINYFSEAQPKGSKSPVPIYNAPGIASLTTGLAGAVRGAVVMAGVRYIVAGNVFYSVNSAGTATSIGTINTYTGQISMAVNNASPQEMCFVDGTDGWTYDTSNGLREITDGDFLAADTVTFLDGYFVFNRAGTGQGFISAINDGQTYSATDRFTVEGNPDGLLAVYANHGELWAFGSESIEIYYNSGDADFPFDRIPGARPERGCAAAFSIADDDNTLFWLGDDLIFYRGNGWTPQRISTHAIEEAIRSYSSVSDAYGFFVTLSGHKFYHVTFPTGGATFVYDVSTNLWHERQTYGKSHWSGIAPTYAYNGWAIGDYFTGRMGTLDLDTYAEYGDTMQGIVTTPHIHADRMRLFHDVFEVDIESGVGLTSGQGSDPQIWMDYSDDGGRTWSTRKPFRSFGKIGEYSTRARWKRLGQSRQRVYRLTISDPVKRTIIAAHLNPDDA